VTRPSFVVLAEGRFGLEGAKTAASAVRYMAERVTAVLDTAHAGGTAADVLGFGEGVPVVASLSEALALAPEPDALLIGVAPQGGRLPDAWRPVLGEAIRAGLDLWSGLHLFLSDDPELSELAADHDVGLVDLRRAPPDLPVATGKAAGTGPVRLLTVGTDCNVGKMTTALELRRALAGRGVSSSFAPTGQTGILLEGWGVAVDAVKSDFTAGAAESLVLAAAHEAGARVPVPGGWREEPAPVARGVPAGRGGSRGGRPEGGGPAAASGGAAGPPPDLVLVEGQGSLLHPGYSGVTLGLLHGSMPQLMVLSWMPGRRTIYGGRYDWVEVPPLDRVVRLYEEAAGWIRPPRPARVVGISAATYDMEEEAAREAVEEARLVTGLPVTDPLRFGVDPLADAVEEALEDVGA